MATSQALTASPVAFAKYPELPQDVRLMIINEAIQITRQNYRKINRSWKTAKPFLFPLASVNHEWNRVIEMRLFNHITIFPSQLSEFSEICGKRHGRLNNINLIIGKNDVPSGDRREVCVGAAIVQLFNIMKDWSPVDRERQDLLKLRLDIDDVVRDYPEGTNLTCNFGTLPQVPMIGALSEISSRWTLVLHPSSSIHLYQSCPNIRRVSLGLPSLGHQTQSTQEARNAITSLANTLPDLTHLELMAQRWDPSRQMSERDAWMPAPNCIAAFSPSWNNNLQQLVLKKVYDIPHFLIEAGQIAWPNLKAVSLFGSLDNEDKAEDEIKAVARETCTALVQGLIAMLPSMPNITTVLIDMYSTSYYYGSVLLGLSLGSPFRDMEPPGCGWGQYCYQRIESCSYRFVRNPDNGIAVAVGTDFPGHLATELQQIVRRQQLKDLGVFYCYDDETTEEITTWGSGRSCWQWDPDRGSWDAAFEEEADEFIYQMGQYLDDYPM